MTDINDSTSPAELMNAAAARLERTACEIRRAHTTSADRDAWDQPAARASHQAAVNLARQLRRTAGTLAGGAATSSQAVPDAQPVEILAGPKTHICWTPDRVPAAERQAVVLIRHADYQRLAAPQPAAREYACPVSTVADLVNNLLMMDQAWPIHGAQYIEVGGHRRAIAVPPTVSLERVRDGRWIGEGDALNAVVVWTKAAQPSGQERRGYVNLSGAQLLQALDFIAPDRDSDPQQLEEELTIQHGSGHSGEGYYAYLADCPDEGATLLDGMMSDVADAQPSGQTSEGAAVAAMAHVAARGLPEPDESDRAIATLEREHGYSHPLAIAARLEQCIQRAGETSAGLVIYEAMKALRAGAQPMIARPLAEWHEDDGPVMWWAWCGDEWAGEPAWCGTPLSSAWPDYHTHWTLHPAAPMDARQGEGSTNG